MFRYEHFEAQVGALLVILRAISKTIRIQRERRLERGGSSQTSLVYIALNGVLSRRFWSVGSGDAHGATELTSRHARDSGDSVNLRAACVVQCTSRQWRDRKYQWASIDKRARTMPSESVCCQTTRMKSRGAEMVSHNT
jgi:hypothetical protein